MTILDRFCLTSRTRPRGQIGLRGAPGGSPADSIDIAHRSLHLIFTSRPRERRTNDALGNRMPLFVFVFVFVFAIYFLLPGRVNDGQTFVSFRRFYFLIFGGNLICPSLLRCRTAWLTGNTACAATRLCRDNGSGGVRCSALLGRV